MFDNVLQFIQIAVWQNCLTINKQYTVIHNSHVICTAHQCKYLILLHPIMSYYMSQYWIPYTYHYIQIQRILIICHCIKFHHVNILLYITLRPSYISDYINNYKDPKPFKEKRNENINNSIKILLPVSPNGSFQFHTNLKKIPIKSSNLDKIPLKVPSNPNQPP